MIGNKWDDILKEEYKKEYFSKLIDFIKNEYKTKTIYPKQNEVLKPPSLKNIFKELESDLGIPFPEDNSLKPWAKQGVLLLNAVLTVEEHKPTSHKDKGWEVFTDNVIKTLNKREEPVVFILWGAYARAKKEYITNPKHYIIESAHPSPFSARNGFFGSKPFSKTNEFLKKNNIKEIDWRVE